MTQSQSAPQMSRRRSLEQERAQAAWEKVKEVAGKSYASEYGQLARSAPADIQINGLGQTLAFWRAKGMGKENSAHWHLYLHVSDFVMNRLKINQTRFKDGLLAWIVSEGVTQPAEWTSTDQYRQATTEAIAFLGWLKRFAEAELGKPK